MPQHFQCFLYQQARSGGATMPAVKPPEKAFLSDVETLRGCARQHLSQGAMTPAYKGDVSQAIAILQTVLATEIVCVLRYTMHSIAATGISSEAVRAEFAEHAREEQAHMMAVAERIDQLGGTPNVDPDGLNSRSASEYTVGSTLRQMIEENLIAERIAVELCRELIRYFGDDDPTTRVMLEGILGNEEEHVTDMLDLLKTQEAK
jgi:bacterioferritin